MIQVLSLFPSLLQRRMLYRRVLPMEKRKKLLTRGAFIVIISYVVAAVDAGVTQG